MNIDDETLKTKLHSFLVRKGIESDRAGRIVADFMLELEARDLSANPTEGEQNEHIG